MTWTGDRLFLDDNCLTLDTSNRWATLRFGSGLINFMSRGTLSSTPLGFVHHHPRHDSPKSKAGFMIIVGNSRQSFVIENIMEKNLILKNESFRGFEGKFTSFALNTLLVHEEFT